MKELLNKKIVKVELNLGSDKDDSWSEKDTSIIFTTDAGEEIAYQANGDCCSTCWFSHIAGIRNLIGQTISAIIEREERPPTKVEYGEGDYDSLDVYGYILDTYEGNCYIEFRNDSNGYYGGSCDLSKRLDEEYREVKEDF